MHGVSRVDDGTSPDLLALAASAPEPGGPCACCSEGFALESPGCPCEEAALGGRLRHTRLNFNVRQVLPYDATGVATRALGPGVGSE